MIDIFAGSGGMASICAKEHQHCLCIEKDKDIFLKHLQKFGNVSSPHSDGEIDWAQYEP